MRQVNEPQEPPITFSTKPAPQPVSKPVEVWKKTERPGVEVNQQGNLRTRIPQNDPWSAFWAGL